MPALQLIDPSLKSLNRGVPAAAPCGRSPVVPQSFSHLRVADHTPLIGLFFRILLFPSIGSRDLIRFRCLGQDCFVAGGVGSS